MAWDNSRPVPWKRLTREWVVYAGIMSVVFLFLFNDGNPVGAVAGVLVSGPMYLGLGWVLAKFGYQRKTMKELRTSQGSAGATGKTSKKDDKDSDGPRHRVVVPSSRTTGGGNRPPSKTNRRR
ncbi:MAG: hypothetical protein O3B90_03675 [Actinomycetota bacterium]|jgi:hypothetical protein|uniref:hypothetical protein n=1 Tax=uncultured Ilumatobacter sp. TaxID=879968 RepID=UPI00374F65F5|nr:hypothetical protein [Actinomycetota bacterium]